MAKFPPDAVGTRPSVTPPPVTPPLAGSGGPRPNRPTPSGDSLSPEDRFRSDRFREFVQRMDRWVPKSFKDSDAMKRFTRRLGDVDWGKAARSKVLPEGFGRNIDLSRRLGGTGRFFERSFDRLEGRRLPKMPNISAPNLPNAPNLGAPGAPSASGAGSAFTVLLVLGTVLAGGFLIWKLLIQPAQARKGKPPEWGPGSWPVDPTRVRTREELIKAYDHLALIRGGKPARHWHHLQVANRFGTDDATRRVAAERLSRAYEKARYAPPQEALSEIQLDAARNDLCSLAGVVAP